MLSLLLLFLVVLFLVGAFGLSPLALLVVLVAAFVMLSAGPRRPGPPWGW